MVDDLADRVAGFVQFQEQRTALRGALEVLQTFQRPGGSGSSVRRIAVSVFFSSKSLGCVIA